MARILISIFYLLILSSSYCQVKFFFSSIEPPAQGGPPQVIIYSFDGKENTTGNTVNHLTGVPAGALLVLTTASGLNASEPTVTSSPSLTWTQRSFGNGGTGGSALIYTAVFSAGGTIDVTSNFLGLNTFYTGSCLYAVQYQESVLGGNSSTGLAQTTSNATITTTRPNSLIFCVSSNWNNVDGGSNGDAIVFRGTGAQKNYYTRSLAGNNEATTVHFTYQATSSTAYTVGYSSPVDGDGAGTNTAVLEIRGQ
jgi:hypothetical protein